MPPDTSEPDPSGQPESAKTEPLACVSCRARKLKCDRTKPACTRCVKVSNECVYPESRRKPNFKRRNVKELEARLAQVEDYLKEVNKNSSEEKTDDGSPTQPPQANVNFFDMDFTPGLGQTINSLPDPDFSSFTSPNIVQNPQPSPQSLNAQLMSLGMTEPLPPDDVMEELNNIFFHNQYRMIPIIHPGKYLQSFYGPLLRRPPMCLRYAIWALAATGSTKFDEYHDIFYRRSRAYIEADMMKIATRLPASEEAFVEDRKEDAPFLDEAIQGAQYTGFAGTILTCEIFKIILRHVHRSKPDSRNEDLMHGSFWTRHRDLDNTLSSLFMFLPEKFRLPENVRDVSALHLNLNLHAAIICLHHAAVEKADKHNLPDHVKQGSVTRLRAAAEEIVNIMRLTANGTLFFKSPLSALSLYCTTTVYVYLGKENPVNGLSTIDLSNFQLIIQSMEAIARVHTITRTFLQQACLDIEKNGLGSVIQVPSLRKYRNAFGPSRSRIPMLARSSVAGHTGASPILFASNFTQEKRMDAEESRLDKVASAMSLGKTCYSAVLGAAARNVEPADRPDPETNKRKRTKESPGPEVMANMRSRDPLNLNLNPNFRGTGMWPASFSPRMASGAISLPDRTNSSAASSPANQGSYTKTVSGSSHTSPDIGLGNSAEENRVDLRAFQERISTPIWQSTEETLFAQMAANTIPLDDGDPWGILNAVDLSWDVEGLPAGS
ncbi:hypothetical protein BFJ72_g14336 [Fusarium proliferatum]|uniref:Zn(2)-C6 fungal-type domain-containing protein n=1 Tax=Gibberella intermedia TaxID=948311 RepID=A0A420S4J0_GIBIN|nr:hypothetical protein BFJ72_g14336 [Fusarium proliferatum]